MASRGSFCQTIQKDLRSYDAPSCNEHVIRSPVPDIKIPDETIPEYVWKNVEKYANHPALVRLIFFVSLY